jgi:hypothetical protein
VFCTPCYYYSDVFDEELCRPQVLRTNAVTYYVILSQRTVFSGAASMRGSGNRESPKKGAEEEADVTRGVGGDSGTKRGTSVGQNLRKWRGRHVTHSFCPPAFPFGWFKEPPFHFNFTYPLLPVQVPKKL